MATNLYCISNWFSYFLVEANSPLEAIAKEYSREYRYLDNESLSDDTVVSVMCCEYKGYVETCLEQLAFDADRVLWMDAYPETLRFQSYKTGEANVIS
ncbi:hypothetical protein [Vibrio hepatarius]|uniref:hypothetical protein n=1 Tax=Vibrio hepatarius TaxID=171383 RepID=UPI001C082322|nr:hypothetical protein [Vibrio hepatarius]MBU2897666.1 hypothetical protein [Vibrio hepatarius]